MTVALALTILALPFAVAAAVGWAAHRSNVLRFRLDLFELEPSGYETYRADHDLDAVRSRFEHRPSWPSAGALGERR